MNEYLGCLRSQTSLLLFGDVHVCCFLQVIAQGNPKISWQTDGDFWEFQRADLLGCNSARKWGLCPVGEGAMYQVGGDGRKYLQKMKLEICETQKDKKSLLMSMLCCHLLSKKFSKFLVQ